MRPDGLTLRVSKHPPRETVDRLAAAVIRHGMTILARIDHAEAAANVGLELRPTTVLIFGNPQAGTLLMQSVQTIGIDLPLKSLVWEDENGQTWLAFNDPNWLAQRHGAGIGAAQVLDRMTEVLTSVAMEATSPEP